MSKLNWNIMIACSEATKLVEKQHTSGLRFAEKIKLKMHLAFCDLCKQYEKQSGVIDEAVKKYIDTKKHSIVHNDSLRERLLNKFN